MVSADGGRIQAASGGSYGPHQKAAGFLAGWLGPGLATSYCWRGCWFHVDMCVYETCYPDRLILRQTGAVQSRPCALSWSLNHQAVSDGSIHTPQSVPGRTVPVGSVLGVLAGEVVW